MSRCYFFASEASMKSCFPSKFFNDVGRICNEQCSSVLDRDKEWVIYSHNASRLSQSRGSANGVPDHSSHRGKSWRVLEYSCRHHLFNLPENYPCIDKGLVSDEKVIKTSSNINKAQWPRVIIWGGGWSWPQADNFNTPIAL